METWNQDQAFNASPLGQRLFRQIEQLALYEQQLESLPPDKLLSPALKPGDEKRFYTKTPAAVKEVELKERCKDIRQDIMRDTDRFVSAMPPEQKKQLREQVLRRISQMRGKKDAEKHGLLKAGKDLDLSQDFSQDVIDRHKATREMKLSARPELLSDGPGTDTSNPGGSNPPGGKKGSMKGIDSVTSHKRDRDLEP